jgi:hypothetical protein
MLRRIAASFTRTATVPLAALTVPLVDLIRNAVRLAADTLCRHQSYGADGLNCRAVASLCMARVALA